MSQPYVGEIRMFAGNFAPVGWMFCAGQMLPISEYETLFNLIGTTYGGDGQETFALPNLQSRVPIHQGQGGGLTTRVIGEMAGVENVTLSTQQIPAHTHPVIASGTTGNTVSPSNAVLALTPTNIYTLAPNPTLNGNMAGFTSIVGGNQPHENMQPFLAINFIISLYGVFPSQS